MTGPVVRRLLSHGERDTLDVVQFVDTVSASPTVRLDLNNESPWATAGVDFSPPPLKYAWSGTLLTDGERPSAAAYGNRRLGLSLELIAGSQDAAADAMQALWRELNRPTNVLKYQPEGATNPVFFRTLRSMDNAVQDYPGTGAGVLRTVSVEIAAEPFAVGLRETLSQVTVSNDSSEGAALNANPFFETNATSWSPSSGTFVRSTAQFHQGVASGLLTPDGVNTHPAVGSELVPGIAGVSFRARGWVRCAVARSIQFGFNWYNASSGYISESVTTEALAANTWTFLDFSAVAPSLTALTQIKVVLPGVAPSSNLLYLDEAQISQVGTPPGMCFDLAGSAIKGDVETPLFLSFVAGDVLVTGRRQSAIAVRRRGTPSSMPMVVQAETMSLDTDATLQFDSAMSGSGPYNAVRISFASAGLNRRLYGTTYPAAPSVDARGTYRVFARVRKSVGGDVMTMRLTGTYNGANFNGDAVTLPSGTDPRWVDLGLLPYPVGYDPVTDGYSNSPLPVTGTALSLYAARTSGSGTIDIDALLLVPADDRYCQVQWSGISGPTAFVLDSGATAVYGAGASGELAPTDLMQLSGLPPMVTPGQASRIVFARDVGTTSSGGDDKTGSTRITPYYWPRYLHVRPVSS
ncbi:hypothetical protein ACPB67_02655 [Micromonospora taraxaci]|uniref:hypothetical protein n=1 Tax=Micromonospora taraxaci TaxID=1316803 RepID=UPI003C2C3E3F